MRWWQNLDSPRTPREGVVSKLEKAYKGWEGLKNRLNWAYVLYGWKHLKFYQFCAARLHVESCALSNKKTLLMKISLLLTELAHFLDALQCDYHAINCQVSKIGLIESTNGWKFFESTKNISPSSPLVHLSGVMLACVSACNRSMNCLPWLHFLRMHFVTVIQALKSTNRIDSGYR